jgi:hypothetical protein
MNRHYTELLNQPRGPFTVILDKSWEDIPLDHLFDTSIDPDTGEPYHDIERMAQQIDSGILDYFVLRVRVFFHSIELVADYCGGFLYADATEVLKDGVAEDMIQTAFDNAVVAARELKQQFAELVI